MMKLRERKVSIKSLVDNYIDNWKKEIIKKYKYLGAGTITFVNGERFVIAICRRLGEFEKEVVASLNFEWDL